MPSLSKAAKRLESTYRSGVQVFFFWDIWHALRLPIPLSISNRYVRCPDTTPYSPMPVKDLPPPRPNPSIGPVPCGAKGWTRAFCCLQQTSKNAYCEQKTLPTSWNVYPSAFSTLPNTKRKISKPNPIAAPTVLPLKESFSIVNSFSSTLKGKDILIPANSRIFKMSAL